MPKKLTPATSSNSPQRPQNAARLRQHIAAEIFPVLRITGWRRAFAPLLWPAFHLFAKLGIAFDERVAAEGFRNAAQWVLTRFVEEVSLEKEQIIPAQGPLLIAANHPGTIDALAIAAHLPRDDLKIVAGPIPFLAALPHTAQHMIFTDRTDASARMTVIRKALRHLEAGGALLIFPSGHLDPDPAIFPGADSYLADWSRSLELFLNKAPETRLQLAIASGVLSPKFGRSPLMRFGKDIIGRQRIAEIFQIIYQLILQRKLSISPKISFAAPLTLSDLGVQQEGKPLVGNIVAAAQQLYTRHAQRYKLPVETGSK